MVEAIARHRLDALTDRIWLAGSPFGGHVALAMPCSAPTTEPPGATARRQAGIDAALACRSCIVVATQAAQAFHPDKRHDPEIASKRASMVADYGPAWFELVPRYGDQVVMGGCITPDNKTVPVDATANIHARIRANLHKYNNPALMHRWRSDLRTSRTMEQRSEDALRMR